LAEPPVGFSAIGVVSWGRRYWSLRMSFMLGAWRVISVKSGTWHGVQISFTGCRTISFDQGPLASGEPFSQNS
jgi:hypothetical protein